MSRILKISRWERKTTGSTTHKLRTFAKPSTPRLSESVNDMHRGEAGDEPAILLITYAGTPGFPTSIPAKGEKAEY